MRKPLRPLREAGYEALFLLGGCLALTAHPTSRNLDDILRWIDEKKSRRIFLRTLEERGLVESGSHRGEWVPLITARGRRALSGGRDPLAAWRRGWDGVWRLLTFDLPRNPHARRMKLNRWLSAQHFGRLQGSVLVSPDPIEDLGKVLGKHRIPASMVMVFEGTPVGRLRPREIAAAAWDFTEINDAYRAYAKFARRVLQTLRSGTPSPSRLGAILREDRQLWWDTMRKDPLLPNQLHPKGYGGPAALKTRTELHKKLGKSAATGRPGRGS